MSKPTYDTKWANNATYTSGPYSGQNTKVEPSSGQKDAGYVPVGYLPAQWDNSWRNGVDQWKVWLAAFESTAHTWSALQSLNQGIAVAWGGGSPPDGSHGAVDALGSTNLPAVYGAAGTGATGVGVRGVGADRSTAGNTGVSGAGGAGTGINGIGGIGVGGLGGAGGPTGAGVGGIGAVGIGGAINGATNSTGAAGAGGNFQGGSVTSDANGRVGGDAVTATAGSGQAGYGNAFHAVHGGVLLDDGNIVADNNLTPHLLGATHVDTLLRALVDAEIDGALTVGGASTMTGVINANGGITSSTSSFVAAALLHSWTTSSGSSVEYAVNPLGRKQLKGSVTGGTSGLSAFNLPSAWRPIHQIKPILVATDGAGGFASVRVDTNGDVVILINGGYAGDVPLDGISFI